MLVIKRPLATPKGLFYYENLTDLEGCIRVIITEGNNIIKKHNNKVPIFSNNI